MELKLTDAEMAIVKPLFDATDAAKQAYVQGLEIAKTLLVQQIVSRRQENEPISTESTQHAAASSGAVDAASRPNGHA